MGVICVKFNTHNIFNMSMAFIEQTMLTCMHYGHGAIHLLSACCFPQSTYLHNAYVYTSFDLVLAKSVKVSN